MITLFGHLDEQNGDRVVAILLAKLPPVVQGCVVKIIDPDKKLLAFGAVEDIEGYTLYVRVERESFLRLC